MSDQLPIRKNIRLTGFDYSQAGHYFVTVCTKEKQCILGTVVGGDAHIAPKIELSFAGTVVERYLQNIPGIDKYSIMPNHIHMVISIEPAKNGPMWASAPTQSLSRRIRSFKALASKELGISIFQRSFYDHIIRNEQDYLRIWRYIEDNPVKWAEDEYYCE